MSALRSMIATAVGNPVLATMITVCLFLGGIISSRGLSRELFPPYSLDLVTIEALYPGASPEVVEEAITTRIEEAVEGIEGVQEISSVAQEGLGTIYLSLFDSANVNEVIADVKDRVERLTGLPREVERPIIQERLAPRHVIYVAVSGEVPESTLTRLADEIRDDLLTDAAISQVVLRGVREEEIVIELSEPVLQAYGLTFQEVMAAVSRGTSDIPAGIVRTADEEIALRTEDRRTRAADFAPLAVVTRPDQTIVRLGQIATLRDTFAETAQSARLDGHPAAVIEILKTDEEDTTTIAGVVRDYVERRRQSLPEGLNLSVWGDVSREVNDLIGTLVSNGIQGFALIVLTLTLFFNLRLSFWVAMGLPVAFGGGLIAMGAGDMSLNMITLFGLILVSGMIDDDAIVIAEQIHVRRTKFGDPPALAAIEGASAVALPVLAGVATTIAAFLPLLFVSGVMGKFIRVLPIVVIAAMLASTLESLTAMPAHLRHDDKEGTGPPRWRILGWLYAVRHWLDEALQKIITGPYRRLYHGALAHRGLTLGLAVMLTLVAAGWVAGGHTPFVVMGQVDSASIRAQIRFTPGVPESVTRQALDRIEAAAQALNNDPELQSAGDGPLVRHTFSLMGEWTRFVAEWGSHLGEVTLELMPPEERRIHVRRVIERWREHIGPLPEALVCSLSSEEIGPTDKPVEIRLHGHDTDVLRAAADEVSARLAGYRGVSDIEDDLMMGKREALVKLKPTARNLGITVEQLGLQLRHGYFGGEAETVHRGREEITVRVRYEEQQRRSLGELERIRVRTPSGAEVPFNEVADVHTGRTYDTLWHQDNQRRTRVWADVDERVANAEQIVKDMTAGFLPDLARRYPGLRYSIGGQRAQIQESLQSLIRGFLMSLLAIYTILAGTLRSYVQPFIMMAVIPLAQVGVVLGHVVMGRELTLISVFGAVALSGVVVNNAIVLVDCINGRLAEGATVRQAVYEAGETRFRPVVLTTITTVVGVLPIVFERSTQAQTIVPMAISVAFGLTVATALTLIVVPALYLAYSDSTRLARWLRRGGAYPSAEAVRVDSA